MTGSGRAQRLSCCAGAMVIALNLLTGCERPDEDRVQGYVEGEFLYIAPPLAGTLDSLHVRRGEQVEAGDLLFALEDTPYAAAREEAKRRLAEARANLADAKKGSRPSEIESLEAQLEEARVALTFSERELARMEKLRRTGAATPELLDRARSDYDQNRQQVVQRTADLETARLGARVDQIAAAEAEVQAREAALVKAEWDLGQTRQSASRAGPVFDTLYREGEWVAAGRPVVALLPPQYVKVRAFVPEPRLAEIQVGETARVVVDGVPEPLVGTVSFISPKAEFTPPVIYSRESRAKLVFLVELTFDAETAATLHPGQPVDVEFGE